MSNQDRLGVETQFAMLACAWGASFLFIKVGLEGLSPVQVVLGRMVFGSAALLVIVAVRRQRLPREPAVVAHLGVVALFLCVVPFLLFAWAEQHVSSGLASIYNATTPLMTVLVGAVALRTERLGGVQLLGVVIGFAGVIVVFGAGAGSGGGDPGGQLACLAATFSYGIAFVYLRRFISPRGLGAIPVATVQVGIGALVMVILTPWIGTDLVRLSWRVGLSVAALGVFGSGLAYVWNTTIVGAWGAANAASVTYLTPVVGVGLGVIVLGESVSWNQPVGAAVVVLGIAVSHGRLRRRRQPATSSSSALARRTD